MARPGASVAVATPAPIAWGDTVTFEIAPPDAGVVSIYGVQSGVVVEAWALVRGDLDVVLEPNGNVRTTEPTDCRVTLSELVHGKVRVIAETRFSIDAA